MNTTAFARLIGVSHPMVSKYDKAGFIIRDAEGAIDPLSSLDALAGHLSADRHARAMAAFNALAKTPKSAAPRFAQGVPQKTGKALKDDLDAELKALDLAERKRELVLASDVDDRARDAVALFRESRANGRREVASKLCALFGIPSDKAPAVARFLAQEDEHSLGVFARGLAALISHETAAASTPPTSAIQATA